jgi:hypothetical protein
MIDLKAIDSELHHVRLARLDAEAASSEVEDLIRLVRRFEPGRGRLCFFIDGLEDEPVATAN